MLHGHFIEQEYEIVEKMYIAHVYLCVWKCIYVQNKESILLFVCFDLYTQVHIRTYTHLR